MILGMCGIVKQLRRFAPPPYIPISEGRGITADSVKSAQRCESAGAEQDDVNHYRAIVEMRRAFPVFFAGVYAPENGSCWAASH